MKQRQLLIALLILAFTVTASAKETWVSVRSKNFFLVGNADEKAVRQVATKLEQFRETFHLLFPRANFTSNMPTNVVVFKNSAAYKPFKPKRPDGKPDEGIAGYFQPGEDVNYITLSTDGDGTDKFGTIFHEYVHFMLNTNFGKSDIPPWFNEGLAEYYQTFIIENDQKVTLGRIQPNHLYLLQQSKLIPLKDLFAIDNFSLHQNGNHSRSIFYAQAWALIHYLIQGNKGANNSAMSKFVGLVMNNVEPETAFQQAFNRDYATMEKELRKYVEQSQYYETQINLKQKLVFETDMTTAILSEADSNAFLGDLLSHSQRDDEAEVLLQKSLAAFPAHPMANTALGLVRTRQRRFDEAKALLEKAIASDANNAVAYYKYAYVLSRQGMDEFGYVRRFDTKDAAKMREALQKSISINPNISESYELLSFVNLVNNEQLDESLAFLKKAIQLEPGNQNAIYLMAQIYMGQRKFAEAKATAQRLFKTAERPELRAKAQQLLSQLEDNEARREAFEKQASNAMSTGDFRPTLRRAEGGRKLTPEERAKIKQDNDNISINGAVMRPKDGQQQLVGSIQKVTCARGEILYTILSDSGTILLKSKDFSNLELLALTPEAEQIQFGCNANVAAIRSLVVYQPASGPDLKSKAVGELLRVSFVPKFFKFLTDTELKSAEIVYVEDEDGTLTVSGTGTAPSAEPSEAEIAEEKRKREAEFDKQRRDSMLANIRENLRAPQPGETRGIGFIEKIDCDAKSMTYNATIDGQKFKLKTKTPKDVKMMAFTPDASGIRFQCNASIPAVPAVITYRQNGKDLEIVALEFVPKSFTLE